MNAANRVGLCSKMVPSLCLALMACCLLPQGTQAVDQVINIGAADGADLLAPGTWNVAVPGSTDVAVFTNTATRTYNLSANTAWQGLAKRYTAFATTITNVNSILTNGASGIDLSQAMGNLTITTKGLALNGAQTWAVTNTRTLTVNSILSGGSGSTLAKIGAGTLTLSGANTYDGQTLVGAGGYLVVSNGAALGSTIGNTVVSNGATLQLQNSSGITVAELLTLKGGLGVGSLGALRNVSGNNTYSGLITLTDSATVRITSAGGTLHIAGGITNATGASLQVNAEGTGSVLLESGLRYSTPSAGIQFIGTGTTYLNVAGTAHNISNADITHGGTVALGVDDALPSGITLTIGRNVASGGIGNLEMNGKNLTVGSLISAGLVSGDSIVVRNSSATLSTLTVNQSTSTIYGGRLSNNLALVKAGPGVLTLTNANNTYTGGTAINAGTLALSGAGTLGGGNISVASAGTLSLPGSTLNLASGQTLTNRGTVSGGLLVVDAGALATGGGRYESVLNMAGGTLTPGVGGDTNYFTDLTLMGDSTNTFWLGSTATRDMSVVTNNLTYGGAGPTDAPVLQLDLSSWTQSANLGQTVVLYDNTFAGPSGWDGTNQLFRLSDATGLFDGVLLTNGMTFTVSGSGAGQFKINYDLEGGGGAGNDILLTVIPEPASLNLLAMLGAAYFMRRRIHRKRGRWNV